MTKQAIKASLTVLSHPAYLSIVRTFVERLLLLADVQRSVIEDIKSAVDEACSNVIKYAYNHDYTQNIDIAFTYQSPTLTITIKDKGQKPRDANFIGRDLDDLKPGGLGMHFIKKAFDKVSFSAQSSHNKLTLQKTFTHK